MTHHVKLYMDKMGYDQSDVILSEISGEPAVDVHHIFSRGAGGTKKKDRIENLMALTRKEHEIFGDRTALKLYLLIIHEKKMQDKGVDYDKDYMNQLIERVC